MDNLDFIIKKYTKHTDSISQYYQDVFSNAQLIANECRAEHVNEIIKKITDLCIKRNELDSAEEVDFDLSDDYWRETVRYTNLLTYLTKQYQNEILLGLKSPLPSVRFYIASAIQEAPFFEAIPYLEDAIKHEDDELNKTQLMSALTASEYTQYVVLTWKHVFLKIGGLLGLTRHSSGTPDGAP